MVKRFLEYLPLYTCKHDPIWLYMGWFNHQLGEFSKVPLGKNTWNLYHLLSRLVQCRLRLSHVSHDSAWSPIRSFPPKLPNNHEFVPCRQMVVAARPHLAMRISITHLTKARRWNMGSQQKQTKLDLCHEFFVIRIYICNYMSLNIWICYLYPAPSFA